MRKHFSLLSFSVAVFCLVSMTGCWTARIWTVVPTTEPVAPVQTVYTTQVTTPSPRVTTVSTFTVTNYSTDPCFYLDLNAVAAAFAESRSVQEFEQLLNSSRYMINNLDLNHDGWIDYLRVIETHKGYYHTLLIQACLAPGVFQDVATLIAEHRADALMVEVVGDTYLYGYNYIVRPVFVKRPPMWDVYGRSSYSPWSSPYHYGHLPSYYTKPKPIYLNHYQAYVTTYMHNHGYCHHCDYPSQPFYTGYTTMTQPHNRHDYQTQHPDDSFEQRVTRSATPGTRGATTTVRNAGQLRQIVAASSDSPTTTTTTTTPSTTTPRTTTTPSTTTPRTTTTPSTTTPRTTTPTTTTTPRTTTTSTTATPRTSVDTRVKRSGETRTTVTTTDSNGRTQTVKRDNPTTTRSSGSRGRR
ncbi:MAG: hypothetical protein II605_06730 [Paludibacteraceae bacterium]|nr:hypothetical protein [Paludibacteraceae bacterium]MBQ4018918.1 hypothetical protein [Paludibacteraceae bacterium]